MRHVGTAGSSDIPASLGQWQGTALVVGCGGIGTALLASLAARAPALSLAGTARPGRSPALPAGCRLIPLELTDDSSLGALPGQLRDLPPLRLVINCAGVLHAGTLQPENRLARVSRANLERSFAVNAFAPLLLAQTLESLLSPGRHFHFASLSARVGSIGDNQLGGWYGYRAAKAAQNQLLRTLAIEWGRRFPRACVSLLHPGTTATPLSEPFRGGVAPARLFTPAKAAGHLLDVVATLTPAQSGQFWAWDGQPIPW